MAEDDEIKTPTNLSLIDCGIKSLGSLNLSIRLVTLNLHSNALVRIEHLTHLHALTHLDLSSNQIERIAGLDSLVSLHSLNLACNRLISIDSGSLAGLRRLVHLNLAYNMIRSVHGLGDLAGQAYALETLALAYNYLPSLDECTHYLSGLVKLKHLTLAHNDKLNDYRRALFSRINSLVSIDDRDRMNRTVKPSVCTCSSQCRLAPALVSTPTIDRLERPQSSENEVSIGPKLDVIEEKIHQLLLIRDKMKNTEKSNRNRNDLVTTRPLNPPQQTSSESDAASSSSSSSSPSASLHFHSNAVLNEAFKKLQDQVVSYQQTQEANLKVIEELKTSLEKCYLDQAKIAKEKEDLIARNNEFLKNSKKYESELCELKRKIECLEEAEKKSAQATSIAVEIALKKQSERLKAQFKNQSELHKESSENERRHQQERINALESSYRSLEDEFRAALLYEAQRYAEAQQRHEQTKSECERLRAAFEQIEQSERRNRTLIGELNELVREQKVKLGELVRARKETLQDVHKRNARLSEAVANAAHLKQQLDAAKKETAILEASLKKVAVELEELKRERLTWNNKLNEQKMFLLHENSRVDAEAKQLRCERDELASSLAREADACKIKAKIIEDQTETIRKMKSAVLERDDIIRKTRDEALDTQKSLEKQLADEMDLNNELKIKLNGYVEMKRDYEELREKWREKSDLIGELDGRVRKMKETYEKKETELTLKSEQLVSENRELKARLRKLDDDFRVQYDSTKKDHIKQLDALKHDYEKKLSESDTKMKELEDEMRQILVDAENKKKFYEDKINNFSQMFSKFQADLKIN